MQTETEDRWYVEVGGAPKMMTLDELVEAFEASTINSKTLVCEVGGSEWKPLSEVADLGDDEEAAPMSQQAPAVAGYATPKTLPPAPAAGPRSVAPVPVGASSAFPAAVARQTLSAWPPAVNPSRPPALGSVPPMSAPSNSVVPPSTMPVVQDLSLPSDDEFKPRRSKAPFVAAAAVLLLVGGALGAAKFGGGGEVHAAVPVPAAPPPPVAAATETATSVAATPPSTPAPTPSSDSTGSSDSDKDKDKASDSSDKRLSDDTKSKLKEADKTRADKKKAAKATRSKGSARSKSSGGSGVFRNGGSADDPLNSKL